MKNYNMILKVIFTLFLASPVLFLIPIYFATPLYAGTQWFIQYLYVVRLLSVSIFIFTLSLFVYYVMLWNRGIAKKDFIVNYLVLMIVPLLLLAFYTLATEWTISLSFNLVLWVSAVAWLNIVNIFGLWWMELFWSWFWWLVTLGITYVHLYLIFKIFKFNNKYFYYIITLILSFINAITWSMMLFIFIFAT
jgi:hypothetical protein